MPRPLATVLLPGLDGTGAMSVPLAQALPASLRPIVIAYPSDRVLDYERLTDWLVSHLPMNEPFGIVAESFSGPLALRLARRRLKGLCGIVLAATFVTCPIPFLPRAAAVLVGAFAFSRPAPIFVLRRYFAGADAPPELVDALAAASRGVRPEVMAARARAIVAGDARADLVECPVPLMYIGGARDRVVTRAAMNAMKRLRPDLQCLVLDAPHLVLQRRPDDAAIAIERFFSESIAAR